MAASSGGFEWDGGKLQATLKTFNARADRAMTAIVAYHATKAVAYARQNAPWTDRTGNARSGLFATPSRDYPKYTITIGHGVPYGIWLEVRWSGRYAIIGPTVQHEGPEVMKTAETLFARIL